ncbi:MAG: hypothetical protein PVJ64_11100 [Gemmatimonadales bacterium]|jgi:hypothetical protein
MSGLARYPLIVFVALALPVCAGERSAEDGWGPARNLGPNINSRAKDEHATLPRSGTVLYFASTRAGGRGGYDLYVSHWVDGEWSEAELLPSPLNTGRDEFDPFITPDGSMLFFASNRDTEGPYWDCDIYVAEWSGSSWSEPRVYDPLFVTPGLPDWGAAMPEDGSYFIFSSGRAPAESASVQIFQSVWRGDRWSRPEPLPPPVNSGGWEATPFVTPDGGTLYLNSGRGAEGKRDVDIWSFELVDGEYTRARLLDGPFLSDGHDYDPFISGDGRHFYFTSDRSGGLGDSDIYVVERVAPGR